jgi:protein-disulfide isomerase
MSKQAREDARARARELREQQARVERRRERMVRIGVAVAVVTVLVAVLVAVNLRRGAVDPAAAVPRGAVGTDGGIAYGPAGATVTVDVWEDFQCPFCGDLERGAGGQALRTLADDGRARVVYHPLTFLGPESVRAANAFACAADAGKGRELHDALYEDQPAERTGGYSIDTLVAAGRGAGLGDDYVSCVRDSRFASWVANVGKAGSAAGITSTPTVMVNGTPVTLDRTFSGAPIEAAVEAAS